MVALRSCFRTIMLGAANSSPRTLDCGLTLSIRNQLRRPNADFSRLCEKGLLHEALQALINLEGAGISPQNLSFLLLECIRNKNLAVGRQVQSLMVGWQLETNMLLANHLIRLFSICGSLSEAYKVFCRFSAPNLYIWTAIISAFVKHGRGKQAIMFYHNMKQSSVKPNDYTYVSILKACNGPAFLEQGKLIHADIIRAGYEANLFVGNTLIDMYAKCGSIDGMRQVFDNLLERDLISWNIIIAGYSQQNSGQHALQLFMQMQQEGVLPDTFTFVSILKACSNKAALGQGKLIHTHSVSRELESNIFIRNALVDMYAKGGDLDEARQVFDRIPKKDVVVWNTMITAYAQQGLAYDAFQLFKGMQNEGTKPNSITFGSLLKACCSILSLDKGKYIHAQIIQSGLESDLFAGSALVDMYIKCGSLGEAREVFDKLLDKDVVSWNVMIAGYAQKGHGLLALELFKQMEEEGMKPNSVTFLSILKACASMQSIDICKSIHKQIVNSGAASNIFVGNALVDMYAKCGYVDEAYRVFSNLLEKDIVSWNAMIHGYVMHGLPRQALELCGKMQEEEIKPNSATIVSILKACGSLKAITEGRLIHELLVETCHLSNVLVGSALVDMYCKCGGVLEARQVFDTLPAKNLVVWNTMITGYNQHGYHEQALQLFKELQEVGMGPDLITNASILKASANLDDIDQVRLIHDQLQKTGAEMDISIGSTLINSYAKCGSLNEALHVFMSLSRASVPSWNAMIGAYVKHGLGGKAIALFEKMVKDRVEPDAVTFVSILKACGSIAAIDYGKLIHAKVREKGLDGNTFVGNALLDMYAKCGSLDEARRVFENLVEKDVVSWNTMISGYAQYGLGQQAIELFKKMHDQGLKADHATFVSVLSACSRTSLLDEGFQVFKSMVEEFGIVPTFHHHSCIVDLLSRAGNLYEAEKFIKMFPVQQVP
ncbi:hypothetical protein O6H91_14G083400 [Diphasiastrum complanatum]|uniref:Uncharacterized protein n=2 Tax=Diphasiastrum complanatum TaxID=34168 RepID=A0ACC2BRF6_DIPCM|nr:hypothetical protein O6H91_14G082800 [Diphasiastrum complanatum]KAJ7532342.1 hypothetical protein O6H91_14G083400 [Diphasiastrum complanatum]